MAVWLEYQNVSNSMDENKNHLLSDTGGSGYPWVHDLTVRINSRDRPAQRQFAGKLYLGREKRIYYR